MRLRAVRLGSIVFETPLWVAEALSPDTVRSETRMSAAGSHIVYEAMITTPYRTLKSMESGWLSSGNVEALLGVWENLDIGSIGMEYDDGSIETVRCAREKRLEIVPIYEGAQWYRATIPLAKI